MVEKRTEVELTVDKEGFPELVEELKKVFDLDKKPNYIDLFTETRLVGDQNVIIMTLSIDY